MDILMFIFLFWVSISMAFAIMGLDPITVLLGPIGLAFLLYEDIKK